MPEHREPRSKGGWRRQLVVLLVSALILAAWIWGLSWLFARAFGKNYLRWYVENGTLISITTAFLALVWQGLEEQKELLSWHPARFLASCATLAGVFYGALAVNLAGPLDGTKRLKKSVWLNVSPTCNRVMSWGLRRCVVGPLQLRRPHPAVAGAE